jgi:hypothetical protein
MLAASWVIDSDEVLVAIRQSVPTLAPPAAGCALELQVLGGRLDHQLRAGQLGVVGAGADAGFRRRCGAGVQGALADLAIEILAQGGHAARAASESTISTW